LVQLSTDVLGTPKQNPRSQAEFPVTPSGQTHL
jgi:hypothetical protein